MHGSVNQLTHFSFAFNIYFIISYYLKPGQWLTLLSFIIAQL